MTSDPRREVVARTLFENLWAGHKWLDLDAREADRYRGVADAVLAALPEYEQVGGGFRFVGPDDPLHKKRVLGIVMMSGWESENDVPLYRIVREPSTPKVDLPLASSHPGQGFAQTVPTRFEPSTPKVERPWSWSLDADGDRYYPECPTCGGRYPSLRRNHHGIQCPDPFHSQGEPEGATP